VALIDLLRSPEGEAALRALAVRFGLTSDQMDAILAKVLPALTNRMERNTLSRGGVADLVAEIARPEHARVAAQPDIYADPVAIETGNAALATVLGSREASRNVAAQAAYSSGISQAIIQKLLPIIASLVMAALAKGTQGGLGDILKRLPDLGGGSDGGQPAPRRRRTPDREPEPQDERSGDGGLGDIFSKIPGLPGGAGGGSPLPIPGQSPAGSPFPMPRPAIAFPVSTRPPAPTTTCPTSSGAAARASTAARSAGRCVIS
jgi:hypothetical protein